jgi:hypothetical protein
MGSTYTGSGTGVGVPVRIGWRLAAAEGVVVGVAARVAVGGAVTLRLGAWVADRGKRSEKREGTPGTISHTGGEPPSSNSCNSWLGRGFFQP